MAAVGSTGPISYGLRLLAYSAAAVVIFFLGLGIGESLAEGGEIFLGLLVATTGGVIALALLGGIVIKIIADAL